MSMPEPGTSDTPEYTDTGSATIGVLGGGQLARMLALAGAPLGMRFLVVDSASDACAGQVAPLMSADWRDFAALEKFAASVDVATFDFENVPADTATWLAERVRVFPNPRALAATQDRLAEKTMFRALGLDTPASNVLSVFVLTSTAISLWSGA